MKRLVIFIMMVLIFVASIGVGYFYLNTRDDQKKESKLEENILNISNEAETVSTETEVEEKISPKAQVIERILYKKCGHEITNKTTVNRLWVNLTCDELENILEDEEIEEFSESEIVLYKEEDGMCSEHYIIGESEGLINIYRLNEDGEAELYEITNIYLDYLPEDEKKNLQRTLEVVGKEELNAVLENLTS